MVAELNNQEVSNSLSIISVLREDTLYQHMETV